MWSDRAGREGHSPPNCCTPEDPTVVLAPGPVQRCTFGIFSCSPCSLGKGLQSSPSPSSCYYSLHLFWFIVFFYYSELNFYLLFSLLEKAANNLNQTNPTFVNCCAKCRGSNSSLPLFLLLSLFLDVTCQHLSIQHTYTQDARITDDSNSGISNNQNPLQTQVRINIHSVKIKMWISMIMHP